MKRRTILQTIFKTQTKGCTMSDDKEIDDLLNEASKDPDDIPGDNVFSTGPEFPSEEAAENKDMSIEYVGDQDLEKAKVAAQHHITQADAFLLITVIDNFERGGGASYQGITHHGRRASNIFVNEFLHQVIATCMNMLTELDGEVGNQLAKMLMSNGAIPHPMDQAKIIKKNILNGKLTIEKNPNHPDNKK